MKIYYIGNGKCVDVIDKLMVINNTIAYAVPVLITGERLINYYTRISKGNVLDIGGRVICQYVYFNADLIKAFPHYFLGDITTVKFYSDAMNILVSLK